MGMVTGSGNTAIHQLFSYDSSGNVVSVDYSSNGGSTFTTYYYLRNAQNDIVKIIDGSGNTVVQYTYDSWGKPISVTGTLASTLGVNQPFRYRGYVYDTETGWYYLQSRYYDPSIGRFISADVYLSTGQGVLGHNAFAYCLNNPVNMSDDSGCLPNPLHRPVMVDDGGGGIPRPDNYGIISGAESVIENFIADRFSTPEKASNTLNAMGFACDTALGILTALSLILVLPTGGTSEVVLGVVKTVLKVASSLLHGAAIAIAIANEG